MGIEKFRKVNPIEALHGDLANVRTLTDIINLSIAFDKPVRTQMQYGEGPSEETLGFYKPEYEMKFGSHGGVIAFFYKGVQYEIHSTDRVRKVLREAGFTNDGPSHSMLSGGCVPTDFQEFWYRQAEEALIIDRDKELSAREKAKEEAIETSVCTPIDEDLIRERCFRIPTFGYLRSYDGHEPKYILPYKEDVNEDLTRTRMTSAVGKMSHRSNGGGFSEQRTFVYLDGHTYTTRSETVIRELMRHGFVESDDVPHEVGLGWGDKIVDPFYADRYERVMLSDREYEERKKSEVTHEERERALLEERNERLASENGKLITIISIMYRNYCQTALDRGEQPKALSEFIGAELGMNLSDEEIEKIQSKIM